MAEDLDAIGEFLCDDGMIYRYRNNDGLEGGKGAFTTCTVLVCRMSTSGLSARRCASCDGPRHESSQPSGPVLRGTG
jgi:hypothetical protein